MVLLAGTCDKNFHFASKSKVQATQRRIHVQCDEMSTAICINSVVEIGRGRERERERKRALELSFIMKQNTQLDHQIKDPSCYQRPYQPKTSTSNKGLNEHDNHKTTRVSALLAGVHVSPSCENLINSEWLER